MNKLPIAVLISDIHYTLNNLQLADAALNMAVNAANKLKIPVIIAGDLHDTKANLRGECINAIRDTLKLCKSLPCIMIGNHDKINEKSEEHSLRFLEDLGLIISGTSCNIAPYLQGKPPFFLVPYQHDIEKLRDFLKTIPKNSTLIMHQGLQGTNAGEYFQDKSALRPEDVAGLRIISGHYHARQTIDLPDGGKWDYIGNPFTTTFGEANDPEKGFQILYSDGSLEFVPTNLRKHVVIETWATELVAVPYIHKTGDLLWFKVQGTREELNKINKQLISDNYGIEEGFRLDLIPTESIAKSPTIKNQTQPELLDSLIDSLTNTSDDCKSRLKDLWKEMA